MAITLNDFLMPLATLNIQVVVKDLQQENICKIYADCVSSLDESLATRTVNRWDIVRNNLLYVYLNDSEIIEVVPVSGVELNIETVSMEVGDTINLVANVIPNNATNKNVTWLVLDENILSLNEEGFTALTEGSTRILVTTEDGGFTDSCEVTVSAITVPIESINIPNSLELETSSTPYEIPITILPENATSESLVWTISDESVATILDGLVTPISEGSAIITVSTMDGRITDYCELIVSSSIVNVESVVLNETEMTIPLENIDFPTLTATVYPDNATYDEIIWSSSDENIATVLNGVITPIAIGTVNIIASVNGIESEPCVVTIVAE